MELLGFFSSLTAAVFNSGDNLSIKSAAKVFPNTFELALVRIGISALVLIGIFLLFMSLGVGEVFQNFQSGFFPLLLLDGALNVLALYFQIRALRLSDASLVAPIQLLTPVILLFTSPLMIGQSIPPFGVVGVAVIVLGTYLMGVNKESRARTKIFAPLSLLFADQGVRFMFVTAAIWGITANLDRMGVERSGPLVWSIGMCIVMTLILFSFFVFSRRERTPLTTKNLSKAVIPGVLNAGSLLFQMYAITILPVPYVIAIKRTSAVMTVLAGNLFFGEKMGFRLLGASVMLFGVVLIMFSL